MKTLSDDLIRCPVCGTIPFVNMIPRGVLRPKPPIYCVECENCRFGGPIRYTEEEAVTAWNKRILDMEQERRNQ